MLSTKRAASPESSLQTLILGIGNAWRGDDAAGRLVAHALRARDLPGVAVVEASVVDPSLLDAWQEVDRLIVVDAVNSGAASGTVHCFDLSRESLPGSLSFCSSHAFDLAALLNLARTLNRLPPQVWVFGVEGREFAHGQAVSAAVQQGVDKCVAAILDLLDAVTD
ncbi:MAG: peptidase M52 [Chloroflexota bacterium]|jgi:hydrogenase maturation protease|nr:MAG: peptidase M52 [Chloroflexota bacterium]